MATIFESDIHDQLIYRRKSLEKGISLASIDGISLIFSDLFHYRVLPQGSLSIFRMQKQMM